MLTGQAGLDMALTAKNDAGVDFFLEKPWTPQALERAVVRLLVRFMDESDISRYFVFREARGRAEIEAVLRLRFEVYRDTPGAAHLLPQIGAGVDVDSYDSVSRHFALVVKDAAGRR